MDSIWIIEWITGGFWYLSIPLVILIFINGLLSAITFTSIGSQKRRWISVGPVFTLLLGFCTALLLLWDSNTIALVIGRLAQFVGLFEAFATLHATSCIALVVVTFVRALYVISEMDNGRYAGTDEVPSLLSEFALPRFTEAFVRLLILIFLTLFAGTFLRIVLPVDSISIDLTGTPQVLADIKRTCVDYRDVLSSQAIRVSVDNCMSQEIGGFQEIGPGSPLAVISEDLIGPIRQLLIPCYVFMAIWTIVVYRSCRARVGNISFLRHAMFLQFFISGSALVSASLMVWWVDSAITHTILGLEVSRGVLSGWLVFMSIVGISVSSICILALWVRMLRFDFVSMRHTWARLQATWRPDAL